MSFLTPQRNPVQSRCFACCSIDFFFFLEEALFGDAPFASETLEELHMKVLDERPIEVREVVRIMSEVIDDPLSQLSGFAMSYEIIQVHFSTVSACFEW